MMTPFYGSHNFGGKWQNDIINWGGRNTVNKTNILYWALKRGIYSECVYFLLYLLLADTYLATLVFFYGYICCYKNICFFHYTYHVKLIFYINYHILYILPVWVPQVNVDIDTFWNFYRHRVSEKSRITETPNSIFYSFIYGSVIHYNCNKSLPTDLVRFNLLFLPWTLSS